MSAQKTEIPTGRFCGGCPHLAVFTFSSRGEALCGRYFGNLTIAQNGAVRKLPKCLGNKGYCLTRHGENCCCQCAKRMEDRSHPLTDGKKAGALRGYACLVFASEGVIHSGWPEHCRICEEFVKLDPETRPCPHGFTRPSKCPECSGKGGGEK